MAQVEVPINGIDPDYRSQLEYALSFADEQIVSSWINSATSTIEAEVSAKADHESVTRKIRELVQRYEKRELGLAKTIDYKNERDLAPIDAWSGLLERKWSASGPGPRDFARTRCAALEPDQCED